MSSLMGASTGSAVVGSVPELVEGQMDGEASTGSAVAVPADVVLPKRSSSMGAGRQLVGLLAAPAARDRASWALPVGALAVVSALSMSVAAGVRFFFFTVEGEMGSLYKSLAVMALVLLLVPLMTLAGAAARLSTSRRDTRLSSLRLLGASSATLRLMTLAENAAVALTGAVLGVFGHVALMPLFGQLHFAGRRIGVGDMWLGLGPVLAAVAAIIVVVVTSAAIGLRRIEISPLGVRTRDKAPRMSWLRAAGGGAAVLLAYFLAQTDVTYKSGKCMVATGTLVDPWTGKTIAYKATVADGAKLQIDHVRALGELWTHGAQNWTQAERVRWANHPANLRAVDGPANGSHSDRTPAAWMPPNKGTGWCEFSTRFVVVTAEMNRTIKPANGSPAAWVSQADKDMLARGLAMCPK